MDKYEEYMLNYKVNPSIDLENNTNLKEISYEEAMFQEWFYINSQYIYNELETDEFDPYEFNCKDTKKWTPNEYKKLKIHNHYLDKNLVRSLTKFFIDK